MRKTILAVALLMLASQAQAQTANQLKLPPLNMGAGYSLKDHAPVALATFDVANYKMFNIEAGYAGRNQESLDEIAGALTVKLMDNGALNFPVLKYLSFRAGYYVGLGRINITDIAGAKIDHGPAVTALVQVKF